MAIAPGTTVATGQFDGIHAQGTVQVVALDHGQFEVRMSGFHTDLTGPYSIALSPFPLTSDRTCLDVRAFELPDTSQWKDGATPIGDFRTMGKGDPSFLDGMALTQYIEADAGQCLRTIEARASFTWTLPDFRPGLAVADSGSAPGATGEVARAGGKISSYRVAPDDVTSEIAARFGISTDDIAWLNPFRGSEMAIAGETINLDRTNR